MDKIDYEDMKYENEEEDASLDSDIEQWYNRTWNVFN